MGLPVAVEIAPPDGPREGIQALLGACSRAVATSECIPAAEAPQGQIMAVAIVTWRGENRAVVEVGIREDGQSEWRSRTVDFRATDEPLERWRTVGFIVGTLARGGAVSETEAEPEPESEPAPLETPTVPRRSLPPARVTPRLSARTLSRSTAQAALDLGAALGPALDGFRTGGVVRTRWPFRDPLRALFALRYFRSPINDSGLRASWLTVSAGLGAVLGDERAEIGIGMDARAEYFEATAESDAKNQSESRWLSGVGFGISGAFMPIQTVGVFVGGDAAYMFSETELFVASQSVTTDAALRVGLEAGVRLRLW
jgi:hypothetical protein